MQNETDNPSVFEDLLHEARTSAYWYASDQSSSRWTRRILGFLLVQFAIVIILFLIDGNAEFIWGWILMFLGGGVVCGILAFALSPIPIPKKWLWEWRLVYMWQLIFFAFLVLAVLIGLFVIIFSID